jgi:hypothetical protein
MRRSKLLAAVGYWTTDCRKSCVAARENGIKILSDQSHPRACAVYAAVRRSARGSGRAGRGKAADTAWVTSPVAAPGAMREGGHETRPSRCWQAVTERSPEDPAMAGSAPGAPRAAARASRGCRSGREMGWRPFAPAQVPARIGVDVTVASTADADHAAILAPPRRRRSSRRGWPPAHALVHIAREQCRRDGANAHGDGDLASRIMHCLPPAGSKWRRR